MLILIQYQSIYLLSQNCLQMSSQDQQHHQSQSDFNQLNKLNPVISDSQQENKKNNKSVKIDRQQNREKIQMSNPQESTLSRPLIIKSQLLIPKKQLTLSKQNKPRLIIDHMVLKNFKSYAGVQKIGPFHKNFTSIVGPNGSGKSNLIQSMLFIFGFSASWMRLNKLHQLIHNSSTMTNVSSAAVQVHFKKIIDNYDGSITQVPNSSFFIRRTVNTSSVSKYYIDGNDSTQAQVKTRLKAQGIDLTNNRFLILQGQVEQISQMKQKSGDRDKPGFLQYLQDIIGSNQYIDRIEQAVKQYNQAEQTKHQKGQRMKLVQNELKSMNSQKQQAIRYVKKQRKLFQIQSVLHQVLKSNTEYELKKVKSKIEQLQRRKQQIIKQEKQKLHKQAQKINEIKKIKVQIQKLQKQIHKDKQKVEQMTLEDNNIKQQIAYNSQDQLKYQKKIDEFNKQFTKIVEQSNQIQQKLPIKQQKLKKMKRQIQQMNKQISKHDKPQLRQRHKQLQNDLRKINHQRNSFADKRQTLMNQINKMNSNKQDHQTKISQYRQMLKKNLQMKSKIQIAQQVATKQYKINNQRQQQQKNYLNRLRNQQNQLQFSLKDKRSYALQQGHFNNMFNHIKKANFDGVYGRLGDLGNIPKEYDQILTTACNRYDNIVCENYKAASTVIEFLKRNRLGRVTCIILDKIPQYKNYMNRPFNCPQHCIRLFDLIKTDSQQARVAFYYALSNTLYCQNSDIGIKVSMENQNNRQRVISKKPKGYGFVIYELNGAINTVSGRRGAFQKKTQQNKKNKGEEDKEIQRKIQQLTRQISKKNQIVSELQKKTKMFNDNFQVMKSQKIVIEGKVRQINDQIQDIQKMIDKNRGKKQNVQSYQKQVSAIDSQLIKINKQINKIENQIQKIENQQKKYQNAQISILRQKYKAQRTQFTRFEKQVQKQQALILSVEKRIKQNSSKKQQAQKRIDKIQKLIERNKQQMVELQNKGMQLYQRMQKNQQIRNQLNKKQDELKKTLQSDQSQVRQSKKKIQQAKLVVDNARRQIRKNQQDYKFACSELQRIRKLYTDMTSTYDFMQNLDQIQKMNLQNNYMEQSSILDLTINNLSSTEINGNNRQNRKQSQGRNFDARKIEKIDPHKDLNQQELDCFLLFEDRLRALLNTQSTELKKMEGKNLQVISEYKNKFMDFRQKYRQFEQVKQKQIKLKKLIDQLKQQRFSMFRQGFGIINSKLKQVYQLLTSGGDAQMQLIDSLDPFSDGVNFSVRPPKKAWKQINKLSGGQKTLSSLSLIFALHYYKPTPLYFMDQIDAALDFKNVSIVGDYIKKRTKDAQFIIISLRNNMFDLADKLVGVYKTFDKTHVINLAAAKILAKRQQQKKKEKQKENQNQNILQRIVQV